MIRYAAWLYYRFTISLRDVEYLLAERGIDVSDEAVRCWAGKSGSMFTANIRRARDVPTAQIVTYGLGPYNRDGPCLSAAGTRRPPHPHWPCSAAYP